MRITFYIPATLVITFLLLVRQNVASYNILGVFPYPGRSHHIVFDSLMVELAARGHNVTVYDAFPKSHSIPNYRQVHLKGCFSMPKVLGLEEMFATSDLWFATRVLAAPFMPTEEEIFRCQPLLDLRDSSETYDLLITEAFLTDFFALFARKFDVPLIVFQTFPSLPWTSLHAGLPENPSYVRNMHMKYFDLKNFWSRLENFLHYLHSLYFYKIDSEYVYDQVAAKFFGPGISSIGEVIRNASMMFVYMHHSYNGARPMPPNVVEVGGLNIRPAQRLPENIEKFINESTQGVIYFSMGSVLRGKTFPAKKRDAFLRAFSRLPQRVLWKWEEDTLPGKSDNIMIQKWMPQRDILAHPNVKLFISHGGLLGTSEAVYEGIPVLGMPIFADQPGNVESIEANGAGERLEYDEISEEVVYEKISRLLSDPKYRENAADISKRYRDRPRSPLDTAVYWTEYVIRHQGAPHLKTAAVHMPWHQYLLLDVIAFLLLLVVMALFIIVYLAKVICKVVTNGFSKSKKTIKTS